VITTFELDGAGCSCMSPTGRGSSFLSGPNGMVMNIDGSDRHLVQVQTEAKGARRVERYTADDYAIHMVWKTLSEGEGGASYDVKTKVSRGDAPPLETTLSCGCGC
jgi:hypothetical protein